MFSFMASFSIGTLFGRVWLSPTPWLVFRFGFLTSVCYLVQFLRSCLGESRDGRGCGLRFWLFKVHLKKYIYCTMGSKQQIILAKEEVVVGDMYPEDFLKFAHIPRSSENYARALISWHLMCWKNTAVWGFVCCILPVTLALFKRNTFSMYIKAWFKPWSSIAWISKDFQHLQLSFLSWKWVLSNWVKTCLPTYLLKFKCVWGTLFSINQVLFNCVNRVWICFQCI